MLSVKRPHNLAWEMCKTNCCKISQKTSENLVKISFTENIHNSHIYMDTSDLNRTRITFFNRNKNSFLYGPITMEFTWCLHGSFSFWLSHFAVFNRIKSIHLNVAFEVENAHAQGKTRPRVTSLMWVLVGDGGHAPNCVHRQVTGLCKNGHFARGLG